jgi:hypothetical protein
MEPTIGPIPIRDAVNAWLIAAQVSGMPFGYTSPRRPIHPDSPAAPDALPPLLPLTRVLTELHDALAAVVANCFGPQCGSLD